MLKRTVVAAVPIILVVILLRHAASFLVVNSPEHADVILVLAGGNDDLRYWSGTKLLEEGYAPRLLLDVFSKSVTFGNRDIDLAQAFVERTTPGQSAVCPLSQSSTYDEALYIMYCLQGTDVKKVLVVTSAYHTRRALSILQKRLPQYQFSIYAASDPYFFGEKWWQTREWAKTTYGEWQKYLWWLFVDHWRHDLVLAN